MIDQPTQDIILQEVQACSTLRFEPKIEVDIRASIVYQFIQPIRTSGDRLQFCFSPPRDINNYWSDRGQELLTNIEDELGKPTTPEEKIFLAAAIVTQAKITGWVVYNGEYTNWLELGMPKEQEVSKQVDEPTAEPLTTASKRKRSAI